MARRNRQLLLVAAAVLFLLDYCAAAAATTTSVQDNKCLCQTSSCLCCVELNLTSSIDLGGPACVNVRHQHNNVSLNLSYADNPLHNATIALGKLATPATNLHLHSVIPT